jgi:hypothetical protein
MAGSDYIHASGTVTFAAGQTTATITITVLGDSAVEGFEGFNVLLSNPVGLSVADGTGNVGITDDDSPPPPPAISIGDASITEGDKGSQNVTLTLILSSASSTSITVTVTAKAGGTGTGFAAAGSDFTAATKTVTFAAGSTTATVTFSVTGDRTAEPNETFVAVLGAPTGGATVQRGTAKVTILDNDGALMAASIGTGSIAPDVTAAVVARVLAEAKRIWIALGADPRALRGVTVELADLGGAQVAMTLDRRILVDRDAAGWGWSTGASPRSGRMDLLTTLVHELGHVLGLEHSHSDHGVMAGSLKAGVRVLPTRATAKLLPKKSRARKHSRRGAKRSAATRRRAAA